MAKKTAKPVKSGKPAKKASKPVRPAKKATPAKKKAPKVKAKPVAKKAVAKKPVSKPVAKKSKKAVVKKVVKLVKKASKPIKKAPIQVKKASIQPKKKLEVVVKIAAKPSPKVLAKPIPPQPTIKTVSRPTPPPPAPKIQTIQEVQTNSKVTSVKSTPPAPKDGARYSDKDLKEFDVLIHEKLKQARTDLEELRQSLSHTGDNSTDDTSPTFKIMEDGSDTMSREEIAQLASRQEKFITALENALLRIKNKTYGICRVTGKLIPKERLRLVPHATLSIEAKNMQA